MKLSILYSYCFQSIWRRSVYTTKWVLFKRCLCRLARVLEEHCPPGDELHAVRDYLNYYDTLYYPQCHLICLKHSKTVARGSKSLLPCTFLCDLLLFHLLAGAPTESLG